MHSIIKTNSQKRKSPLLSYVWFERKKRERKSNYMSSAIWRAREKRKCIKFVNNPVTLSPHFSLPLVHFLFSSTPFPQTKHRVKISANK